MASLSWELRNYLVNPSDPLPLSKERGSESILAFAVSYRGVRE
jgi:hypothetical protein